MPVYYLFSHGTCVGEMTYGHQDMPWIHCQWKPEPGFDRVQAFFGRELELLNQDKILELVSLWEKGLQEHGLSICAKKDHSGPRLGEFIMHIEADRAWFTGDPDELEQLLPDS